MVKNSYSNRLFVFSGGRRFSQDSPPVSVPEPLVSIIIPSYNCIQTIEKALQSAIAQEQVDKEIIVIDGGSTDGTIEILKKYETHIDYWVSEPDGGVYDAYNKGIDLALGDWLYFLGADDWLFSTDVLKKVFFRKPEGKMVYGNVYFGDQMLLYDGKFEKNKLMRKNICHQAAFYHRDVFLLLGKYDISYRICADWILNMKCFKFKSEIRPEYKDLEIAYYSNSGVSTKIEDTKFICDYERIIYMNLGIYYWINIVYEKYFNRLKTLLGKS